MARRLRRRSFYRILRVLEFVALFGLIPFFYFLRLFPIPVLLFLWIMSGIAALYLWRHPKVRFKEMFSWKVPKEKLSFVLKRFLILSLPVALAVYALTPDRFLDFPVQRTEVWLLVLGIYPIFSVIPQSLIYRKFFELRYRPLFSGNRMFILGGAISFSYMHLIYENWIAVAMTLVGGYMFMRTYVETRSFLLSCLEHALYGCLMFTIGLGHYFYLGSG